MKKKTALNVMSICIIILSMTITTTYLVSPKIQENIQETTTVYLSPASTVGPPPILNATFTLDINIDDVTNLYGWGIGLSWNASILNCTGFAYNYTFFGGGVPGNVLTLNGTINNTLGVFEYIYAAAILTPYGVTGSGTIANATFLVKDFGTTPINIRRCELENFTVNFTIPIPFSLVNSSFTLQPNGPTAVKTHTPTSLYTNLPIMFNASASEPGFNGTTEVPIANYTWDFGDGNVTTVTDPIINHTYTTADNYTVTLNVTCQDPILIARGIASVTTSQDIIVHIAPDNTPPTISNVAQDPAKTEVDANDTVTVTATVTDTGWGVQTVLLRYSTDNATFTNVTMTLSSGNTRTGQIPEQIAGTYVSYKIFANDTAGNSDETTLSWYRVKQPSQFPWLWIAVGVAIVGIGIIGAVYLMRRKRA